MKAIFREDIHITKRMFKYFNFNKAQTLGHNSA